MLQAALLRSQEREALGQLAASVAGNFDAALDEILRAFSQIRRGANDLAIDRLAAEGEAAADRVAALARQTLAFARRRTSGVDHTDVRALIDRLAPNFRYELGSAIALRLSVAEDLPLVSLESFQLQAALIHLVANARDAMRDGGTLTITAEPLRADGAARPAELDGVAAVAIHVADDGCGMPPTVLQRALQPFFTTKARPDGAGLGLPMAHGLMLQAGGALRIDSAVGEGTTVSLFVPAAGRPHDVPEIPAPDVVGASTEPPRRGGRVLLVADAVADDPGLASRIADLGYEVVQVAGGGSGWRTARDPGAVDFIVRDQASHGAEGRSRPPGPPGPGGPRPGPPRLILSPTPPSALTPGERVLRKPFTGAELSAALLEMQGLASAFAESRAGLDRLAGRLRSPQLAAWLERWRRACPPLSKPRGSDLAFAAAQSNGVVLVSVDQSRTPVTFQLLDIDAGLARRVRDASGAAALAVQGDERFGSWEGAYRRCARSGKPTYEFARYGFGEGEASSFERLLLPCAEDGSFVDTLIAVVSIVDSSSHPMKEPAS